MTPHAGSPRCVCLTCGQTATDLTIAAGGRTWLFESHPYCGPVVLSRGNPAKHQPPGNSPFWHAVELWIEQGRRVDAAGRCLWVPKPTPRVEHLGGRNYLVLDSVGWSAERGEYIVRSSTP